LEKGVGEMILAQRKRKRDIKKKRVKKIAVFEN